MDKYKSLFDRGGLSLDRLRNFVLISDAGGVSRAADGEPARMSLFSKQIKELESFFGAALTRRQGRVTKLTDAGNQLAQLIRVHLSSLEDFQHSCQGLPQTLSIASGNSLLAWLLLPHLATLRKGLPNTHLELQTGRTNDLVQRLTEMSVDVAILREDAVARTLKFKRLLLLTYSLFVPKQLAGAFKSGNLAKALAALPMASNSGGQFREDLEKAANRAGCPLRTELSCSSFLQAARAVQTGEFGAVLPSTAAVEFSQSEVVEYQLPFLKSYARPLCLAWNPRLTSVRPSVERAIRVLEQALKH